MEWTKPIDGPRSSETQAVAEIHGRTLYHGEPLIDGEYRKDGGVALYSGGRHVPGWPMAWHIMA